VKFYSGYKLVKSQRLHKIKLFAKTVEKA